MYLSVNVYLMNITVIFEIDRHNTHNNIITEVFVPGNNKPRVFMAIHYIVMTVCVFS